MEERQKRRQKEQIRNALHILSSNLSNIGLKLTTATGSHEKIDVMINDPTTDGDCVNQSITASLNYLMLKHGVPISFYHELSKQFKNCHALMR